MSPIQLYVWSPALNAPSIDPKCIIIQAYLRLLEVDFTVVHANDPQYSPTGNKRKIFFFSCITRKINHGAFRTNNNDKTLKKR